MRRFLIISAAAMMTASCGNKYSFDASGVFEATEVIVSAEASGRIMELNITEGDKVIANQRLGFIDTTQLYLKKLQLLSSMKAVDSRALDISKQIAATREQIATQQREKERVQKLIAANAANTKQLDDINSAIAVLEKQLTAQKATLESGNRSVSNESSAVEIQIAQTEDLLAKSIISSPINGVILAKYTEQGEIAATGKPLFKVADIDNIFLRAYITAGQLTTLKIGQKASVFADDGNSGRRQYEGIVTWIADKAEFTPKTIQTRDERANLVYAIKIAVKNDGLIKIGMYGDVNF